MCVPVASGPYRVSELARLVTDGAMTEDSLVTAATKEAYAVEDDLELQVDTHHCFDFILFYFIRFHLISFDFIRFLYLLRFDLF